MSILLVDDDADDHRLVRTLLSELPTPGTRLRWATDCRSAADAIRTDEFDVCIVGSRAGTPNGPGSWESVRGESRLPVIFLSSEDPRNPDRQRSKIEPDDHLTKGQLNANLLDRSIRHAVARWKRKNKLLKRERMLHAQSEVNRAVLHLKDEEELLREICRILVETAEYKAVRIVFAENDKDRSARTVVGYGIGGVHGQSDPGSRRETLKDDPTDSAILTRDISIVRSNGAGVDSITTGPDLPHFEGVSAISLPIFAEDLVLGAITIDPPVPYAVDVEEIAFLRGVSDILSFGIETARLRCKRMETEEALVSANQQLHDIIEFLPDATLVIDRNGEVIAWNHAMEEMTGVPAAAIVGRGDREYAELFYGERRPMLIDLVLDPGLGIESSYTNIWRKGATLAGETYIPALKGREVYLFGAAGALLDSKGNVVGAIESIRDITDRRRVEEALLRAKANYRNMFQNAVAGIYQTTLSGRFIKANPAFAQILKYDSPEEVVNTITDISRQVYAEPERRSELLRQIAERDVVREFEARFLRKDGEVVWVVLYMRAVRNKDGSVAYLEGTILDITDRKALEARLIQSQKMEAIGTLAGGIAHDFNNILAAILGYAELTQQNLTEPKTQCYIQQILKACDRARHLISQILTFSRKTELELEPLDMGRITRESLKLLRAMLPATIEIRTTISSEACIVIGDSTQMHQIMMNLCANAAHAMREDGGILDVCLESTVVTPQMASIHHEITPGPYVKLTVRDTGTGIPPSIMNRIFDPFFTTKERGAGTGLGLSVVYAAVKERGGTIAVESNLGEGTTFNIYLPAAACETEAAGKPGKTVPGGSEQVLFIDDEETLVEMAREMLQELGYEVVAVKNGARALDLFLADPDRFDLVITDMTMPGMKGTDVARKMLDVRPDVPIILCTGFSELVTEEKARHLGIRVFLMKPYTLTDLSSALRKALEDGERQ